MLENTNMDRFLTFILCEMAAADFAALLRETRLPHDEQVRLARLAHDRENEMIAEHVMYPNEY